MQQNCCQHIKLVTVTKVKQQGVFEYDYHVANIASSLAGPDVDMAAVQVLLDFGSAVQQRLRMVGINSNPTASRVKVTIGEMENRYRFVMGLM